MLTPRPKVQGKVLLLPVDKIVPSAHQARTHFDEQEIARLALSIAQNGLLQPVSVRPGQSSSTSSRPTTSPPMRSASRSDTSAYIGRPSVCRASPITIGRGNTSK